MSNDNNTPSYLSPNAMSGQQQMTMWLAQARGGTTSGYSQGENAAAHNVFLNKKIAQTVPYGTTQTPQQRWDAAGLLAYKPRVDYHNPGSYSPEDQEAGRMSPTANANAFLHPELMKPQQQAPMTSKNTYADFYAKADRILARNGGNIGQPDVSAPITVGSPQWTPQAERAYGIKRPAGRAVSSQAIPMLRSGYGGEIEPETTEQTFLRANGRSYADIVAGTKIGKKGNTTAGPKDYDSYSGVPADSLINQAKNWKF